MKTHLTETELATRWTISRRTLQRWRRLGVGLDFIRLRRRIVYSIDDIAAFEAAKRSTLARPTSNHEETA